jgi:tRNA threonylcarbamoyladenosine dehydratase
MGAYTQEAIIKRFGGVVRLYGPGGFEKINRAHVLVVGIGGVGSWTAEMLARSGVGKITLVDLDDVCESNINRQVHALQSTIGQPKVTAMANRIRDIHPGCEVVECHQYLTQNSCEGILSGEIDFVFDAIDSLRNKIIILNTCRSKKIPLLVSGGAGGRMDPTQISVSDLSQSRNDRLLQKMRKELRMKHGFPRDLKRKFGVSCVYSRELVRLPLGEEQSCEPEFSKSLRLDCESGYGTAGSVTATFGMVAASWIVSRVAEKNL